MAVTVRPRCEGDSSAREQASEPATQDVTRHGFVLVTEQVMQITRSHLAGLGDTRWRQVRVVQVSFDEVDDADAMRGGER
jgi:hypothetical protein